MSENYTLVGLVLAAFGGLFALYKGRLEADAVARKEEALRLFALLQESDKRNADIQKELLVALRLTVEKREKDTAAPP